MPEATLKESLSVELLVLRKIGRNPDNSDAIANFHLYPPCSLAFLIRTYCYNTQFPFHLGLLYAPLVTAFYSHAARSPGRCRGRQSQVPRPGRLHSPTWRGNLFVSFSGQSLVQQDHCHRSRGNGPHWTGILSACASSSRIMGIKWPLVGHG